MSGTTATESAHTTTARRALEEVCSGKNLYLELFSDLSVVVDEQVSEGDRVASRWTLRGTHRGRTVTLRGIVISRFEDGRIIEDWAASDTMEIPRQLGVWRTLLLSVRHRRLLRRRS